MAFSGRWEWLGDSIYKAASPKIWVFQKTIIEAKSELILAYFETHLFKKCIQHFHLDSASYRRKMLVFNYLKLISSLNWLVIIKHGQLNNVVIINTHPYPIICVLTTNTTHPPPRASLHSYGAYASNARAGKSAREHVKLNTYSSIQCFILDNGMVGSVVVIVMSGRTLSISDTVA